MNEGEVLEVLARLGAVITDSHVVYTSGRHGTAYMNKDKVFPHSVDMMRICQELASRFTGDRVETVIAPAVAGVNLTQLVAHHLSEATGGEVFAVYAEKETEVISDPEGKDRKCFVETGDFVVKRDQDEFVRGKRVLVLEDVLTTGGSAKKVVEAVRALGGEVVGLGCLCNRGGITPADVGNVPRLEALVNVMLDSWPEAECPLCVQGVPVNTSVGKGKAFLGRKKAGADKPWLGD